MGITQLLKHLIADVDLWRGIDDAATGGTIKAAWELVKKFNPKKCYMNFIIEIRDEGLTGRENIGDGIEVTSLIRV